MLVDALCLIQFWSAKRLKRSIMARAHAPRHRELERAGATVGGYASTASLLAARPAPSAAAAAVRPPSAASRPALSAAEAGLRRSQMRQAEVDVGFGRIVASEIEAPNMSVDLV